MDKPVIILGSKGIAKAAYEIFKSNKIIVYGFLDDDKSVHGSAIDDVTVLGNMDDHGFLKLIGQKCEAFIAVDENKVRQSLVKILNDNRKTMPINAIHADVHISESAEIGHGNFLNAKVFLGAEVKLGQHCILNTGVTIDHESIIGDFVQIGAGTTINAGVEIEEGAFIGSGVTIISGIKIGKNARIGAGSVVIASVDENKTVFGNPAIEIKK
ncbi:MAG: sugar O-acyltransferase (sialic acid O-acetyltransferase NeuD family) [Cyclobacteriaceae bacterium]|jgi:sugar O-acyltransferase (sialic acid O-acetyltransferase NeuD family)